MGEKRLKLEKKIIVEIDIITMHDFPKTQNLF